MGEPVTQASVENMLIVEDRISQLHQDILVRILSFLTVKQAARTSVLSKCFKDLWKSIHRLDFDAPDVSRKLWTVYVQDQRASLLKSEGYKYIEWVNKVLQSHNALVLEEFNMRFPLDQSMQGEIDKWLCYAFARKVQKLELETLNSIHEPYVFPHELLQLDGERASDKSFPDYCVDVTHMDILGGFTSIRSLRLSRVSVTGDMINMFLRVFNSLEHLAIHGVHDLTRVEVLGSSVALKHLELCLCSRLQSVSICDINLVSLKVTGTSELMLRNVPKLVDVCILERSFDQAFSSLSSCLSNLEILTLDVWDFPKTDNWLFKVLQPNGLKQLNLSAPALESEEGLIFYAYSTRAFPNLEKFVLKLKPTYNIGIQKRALRRASSLPLQHLKVFQLHGYEGRALELELVKHFLENAKGLERLTVEPLFYRSSLYVRLESDEVVRTRAKKQLEELISCIDLAERPPIHLDII